MRTLILLLALAIAHAPASAAVLTVCGAGCTHTTINAAIAAMVCGDVIELPAGTTTTEANVVLTAKSECGSGYYEIRSSRILDKADQSARIDTTVDAALMATIASTTDVVKCAPGARQWRLRGIKVLATAPAYRVFYCSTQAGWATALKDLADLPDRIQCVHCWITASAAGPAFNNFAGIIADTKRFQLINSVVDNIRGGATNSNSESHGIATTTSAGPWLIKNSKLEASTIAHITGGSTPAYRGIMNTGSRYVGVQAYRRWAWKYYETTADPTYTNCLYGPEGGEKWRNSTTGHLFICNSSNVWVDQGVAALPADVYPIKNLWEWKVGYGIQVNGMVLSGSYDAPTIGNQNGPCFLFNQVDAYPPASTFAVENTMVGVRMRNVLCKDVAGGLSFGMLDPTPLVYGRPMGDISISNSRFDLGDPRLARAVTSIYALSWTAQGPTSFTRNLVQNKPRDGQAEGGSPIKMNGTVTKGEIHDNVLFLGGSNASAGQFGFYSTAGGGSLQNGSDSGDSNPANDTFGVMYGRSAGRNLYYDPLTCLYGGTPCFNFIQVTPSDISGQVVCITCRRVAGTGLFTNYATGDFSLTAAHAGTGQLGATPGPDHNVLGWSTEGIESGVGNTYLDFQIKRVVPAATSAVITYTAYSTTASTVLVTSDAARTVAVYNSADAGGAKGRSVAVSGLAANTRYWVRITDGGAGSRYRDLEEPFLTNP